MERQCVLQAYGPSSLQAIAQSCPRLPLNTPRLSPLPSPIFTKILMTFSQCTYLHVLFLLFFLFVNNTITAALPLRDRPQAPPAKSLSSTSRYRHVLVRLRLSFPPYA